LVEKASCKTASADRPRSSCRSEELGQLPSWCACLVDERWAFERLGSSNRLVGDRASLRCSMRLRTT